MNNEMHAYISRTAGYHAQGRLSSPKGLVGRTFGNPDGSRFVVFKQTVLSPEAGTSSEPQAMFRVQFRVSRIRPWLDRLVIAIKSPIFVGAPGFRSKLWMADREKNTYQGVYEWETIADAEAYAHSASMGFMTQIAVPGGISHEVIPGGRVAQEGGAFVIRAA